MPHTRRIRAPAIGKNYQAAPFTLRWAAAFTAPARGLDVTRCSRPVAGRLSTTAAARVFTQTTKFVYNGIDDRIAVDVAGHSVTTYTLDNAASGSMPP